MAVTGSEEVDDARIKIKMQEEVSYEQNDDVEGRFDVSVDVGGNDNDSKE